MLSLTAGMVSVLGSRLSMCTTVVVVVATDGGLLYTDEMPLIGLSSSIAANIRLISSSKFSSSDNAGHCSDKCYNA